MKAITGIILAAGEGTRMKSGLSKVLHGLCGRPMLEYMLDLFQQLDIKNIIVVVGHRAEQLKQSFKASNNIRTVRQPKLLGSGDAVWQAKKAFSNFKGDVLVVYGDTPLISYQSLKSLICTHQNNQPACTILTAVTKDPTGFGRIIRGKDSRVSRIIEEQDADTYERAIGEINIGAYCFKAKDLFSVLMEIKPNNAKSEYYLTDTIKVLNKRKAGIESVSVEDNQEAFGINSRSDLSRAHSIMNQRNIENLISGEVTVLDPVTTCIYGRIEAGRDTIIYPHTVIEGKVKIGKNCRVGPFAHIRSGTILEDEVEIGNFVELVRTRVGTRSKIKHHSYIGDATIGKEVNVGAGTITANYDGRKKNRTFIGDNAFIGVGTILIAPVKIGKGAVTGAGSVITKNKDVPAGATVVGIPARILKRKKRK